MGTHKWKDIKGRALSREAQADVAAGVAEDLLEMDLAEIRREAGLTQEAAAEAAEMTQSQLSKFERRDDYLLSSLRRYIAGLGGELEVVAVFGDRRVRLRGV